MPVTLPFGRYGSGWKYLLIPRANANPSGWDTIDFDDSAWSTGQGGFGNGTLISPQVANTAWTPDTQPAATANDLLLRLLLPFSCKRPLVTAAVDDTATFRVNGAAWFTQGYTAGGYQDLGIIPYQSLIDHAGMIEDSRGYQLAIRCRDDGGGAGFFDLSVRCVGGWVVGELRV